MKILENGPKGVKVLKPKVFKDNPDVGTAGIYELYTRLSFVCYLREKILNCPDTIDPEYLHGISKIKD